MPKVYTDWTEDGTYYVKTEEDVEPLIDSLAEHRNHADQNGYRRNEARWRKVGELPMTILDQWFREGFNAFEPANEKELRRRLQGEYKKFLAVDKL